MSRPLMITKFFSLFSLMLVAVLAFGCTPAPPPTGVVSGTVTSGGKGVDECSLEFYNVVTKESTGVKVDDQGMYLKEGILYGDYQVAVHQAVDDHTAGKLAVDKRIPTNYRNVKTSGVKVTVMDAQPVVLDIEMK